MPAATVGLPLRIAGMAGYYLCFVPRKKRGYFPFYLAFVLVGISWSAMIVLGSSWLSDAGFGASIIEKTTSAISLDRVPALGTLIRDFHIGFWLSLFGLALLAIFFAMYRTGRTSLPIRVFEREARPEPGEDFDTEQRRTMFFAWALISLTPLATLGGVPLAVLLEIFGKFANTHLNYVGLIQMAWVQGCFFLFLILVLGSSAKKTLRESFRIPPLLYVGFSILLPATLAAIWPLLNYVYDRIHWAAFAFGMYDAPDLKAYLTFPIWWHLWLLAGALIEEIAWRGFLQPRFVRTYGFARGIFLVGIVWGAFHFSVDFRSNMGAASVAVTLIWRLYMTVALSYVLAWLTIRSRSVLPAALAHGFYNIFLNLPVQTSPWLMPALWSACAWILFRYFPVETTGPEVTAEHGPTFEHAV